MTFALLTVLLMLLVGVPLALSLPGGIRRPLPLLGESYLLGAGATGLLLMVFSIAHLPWSRGAVFSIAAVAAVIAAARFRAMPRLSFPRAGWWAAIDAITLALVAGYARLATLAPPTEADFYLIWGVKAKLFWFQRGIDWSYLEDRLNIPAHVDYPLLLPFIYDVQALVAGGWPEERWLGVVHVAFGVAALLAVGGLLEDELPRPARAFATLLLMPLLFSPYFGLPEGLLTAYGTAGLLFIRSALAHGDPGQAVRGAVYLGLAASCKNEGLALAVAAVIAAAYAPRIAVRLWPAVAIPLPWLVLRWQHDLATDLAQGGAVERLVQRLSEPATLVRALGSTPLGQPLFWTGVVVALAIGLRRIVTAERFLLLAVAIQLMFFVGAYLVTPHDLAAHVAASWGRIVRQLLPAITLIAIVSTAPAFRTEPSPH